MRTRTQETSIPVNPTAEAMQDQVILANKQFYEQIAQKYDHYESCASDPFFRRLIEDDLNIVGRNLPKRGEVHCLDCGGGTGNMTLKMLRRGWHVTVVDVSPDMLEILKQKVNSAGYSATFINESIESFLARSVQAFDLVSFSSVLHHLYSPLDAINAAIKKIAPQGFFYSVFDPVPPAFPLAAGCFTALDTVIAKVLHDRADFLPGLVRRIRKFAAPRDLIHARAVLSPGDLAEYHARKGLDDQTIQNLLLQGGFSVDLRRYPVGRTAPMRLANRHLSLVLSFKILAQRTTPS